MALAPEERYPREGRSLDPLNGEEHGHPVSYSTSTSTARRIWWKGRAVLRLPVRATRQK
ncbi:hypothetical protein N7925_35695 [Streptomyces sp. CA-278952]|uniref:hypothetical protein n=1 Tax=unclassified Streptomyces TaxID=2593676 RepID=UPI002241DDB7|nr:MULTISPECIES: hypothetical protein [unclassified Streptomyces]UZI33410.1 hypothetical protein OH133_37960 [Streptomyces sp. VB1]WDG33295.1 hypothetical protein N7925_35695 [Streptomyces sp. CA-278952]